MTEKPWSYYFVIIAINSFFFYLITLDKLFLRTTLSLLLLTIILITKQQVNLRLTNRKLKRNILNKRFKPDFKDFIDLTKSYMRINRRSIMLAIIAILIPSIIISQISIVYTNQQQSSLNSFLTNSDTSAVRVQVSDVSLETFQNWKEYFDENYDDWITDRDFKILQTYTYEILSFKIIMGERYNFDIFERWIDFVTITTQQWTFESYKLLSMLPTFPDLEFNATESLLVLPVSLSAGNLGIDRGVTGEAIPPKSYAPDEFISPGKNNQSEFKILTDSPLKFPVEDFVDQFVNITHSVDQYWQLSYLDIRYIEENEIELPGSFSVGSMFVPVNHSANLFNKLQKITFVNNLEDRIWGELGLESVIFTTIPILEQKSPNDFINSLDEINNQIGVKINVDLVDIFRKLGDQTPVQVFSPLHDRYASYWQNVSALNYIYLLTALPLLLLSVYLFYFSQILSKKSYERNWRNMSTRGAALFQLRLLILVEGIIISLSGSIMGFLISLPLSNISLNSFSVSQVFVESTNLIIPTSLYWRLPLIALTIVFNFNLSKLIEIRKFYSQSRISENTELNKFNKDFWVLIGIIISTIYWLVRITDNLEKITGITNNQDLLQRLDLILFVAILIGLPALLASQFGKSIQRILPLINSDLLIISIKSLTRQKHFVKHLIVVIFTSIMISSSVLVVQFSIHQNEVERGKYLNGADILIDDININNKELMTQLKIEGVTSVTEMIFFEYKLQSYELTEKQKYEENIPFYFLGINTTSFKETAYWSDNYSEDGLQNIIEDLDEAGNVAVDLSTKERFDLEKNRPLQFKFGFKGRFELTMIATAFFSLYPNFIEQDLQEVKKNYVVGSLFTVDYISFVTSSVFDKRVYLKTDPDYDLQKITNNLRSVLGSEQNIKIYSHEEAQRTIFSDIDDGNDLVQIESELLAMMTDILLVYSFLIAILISVYYSFLINSTREREFEIYRSLGATKKQKSRIIFLELTLIAIYTVLLAMLSSIFVARIFNYILIDSVASVIPAFEMNFPWIKLSGLIIAYTSSITIATILIAQHISTKKTKGLFRNN
ncbi:MAG: ABC transporter permease [Candidatus Heimdallarchaeota archaeon]|nr:ABC transporter permease [Candidatus Heimdallarchaeota archaeon]